MPAQPPPVLTRRVIVRAALDLMDRDGYAAFNLPRLGEFLGIRTPSLYHHFRDRGELLAQIARAVVGETELPTLRAGEPWTEYYVELSVNFRRTILRHRNTAPILLQYLPRDVMTPLYERSAALLGEISGLPLSLHLLVLDGLEKLTLGTALIESTAPGGGRDGLFTIDPELHPRLAAASAANDRDAEQMFVASLRAFLDGVLCAAGRERDQPA